MAGFQHPERKPRSNNPPHFCDAAPPVAPGRIAVSADRFDPRFYDSLYALPVYEGLRMNNYGYAPLTVEEGGGGELEGQGQGGGEAYQREQPHERHSSEGRAAHHDGERVRTTGVQQRRRRRGQHRRPAAALDGGATTAVG